MAEWFKQQAVNLSYIGSNPIPCATHFNNFLITLKNET